MPNDLNIGSIIVSFLVTIGVYTLPVLIFRLVYGKPVSPKRAKSIAIIYSICSFIVMSLILALIGNGFVGSSILVWGFVDYAILKAGYSNVETSQKSKHIKEISQRRIYNENIVTFDEFVEIMKCDCDVMREFLSKNNAETIENIADFKKYIYSQYWSKLKYSKDNSNHLKKDESLPFVPQNLASADHDLLTDIESKSEPNERANKSSKNFVTCIIVGAIVMSVLTGVCIYQSVSCSQLKAKNTELESVVEEQNIQIDVLTNASLRRMERINELEQQLKTDDETKYNGFKEYLRNKGAVE